jgi:FkbM family methyltransferase
MTLDLSREHPEGWVRTDMEMLTHNRLLAWDIRPGDKVIIIGGYDGGTVQMISDRYPLADVYTFEPQRPFYDGLVERFRDNPRVHVNNYGLGNRTGTFPMVRSGSHFASFLTQQYSQNGYGEEDSAGELREFVTVMEDLGIEEVAWFHLNCEQYEYVLIPHLIARGWARRVGQFVIATHGFPNIESHPYARPWEEIVQGLSHTHDPIWEFTGWHAFSRPDREVRDIAAELRAAGVMV